MNMIHSKVFAIERDVDFISML